MWQWCCSWRARPWCCRSVRRTPRPCRSKTWVNGLCTNLVDWRDDLEQQSSTFQSTVNDLDTVAEVKSAFVDFLDGAIASTKTMIANVKALGTPKVANGKGIAGVITTGIGEVQARVQGRTGIRTGPPEQAGCVQGSGRQDHEEARRIVGACQRDLRLRQEEVRHEIGRRRPQERLRLQRTQLGASTCRHSDDRRSMVVGKSIS